MAWKRGGGGCMMMGNSRYPCDDIYRNTKTGKEIIVFSTKSAHFTMPDKVEDPKELLKIKGVKKEIVDY